MLRLPTSYVVGLPSLLIDNRDEFGMYVTGPQLNQIVESMLTSHN